MSGEFTNGDWSDVPIAMGAVYGFKGFDIDKYGRLRSPFVDHIWTPGENVSNQSETNQGFFAYSSEPEYFPGKVQGIIKGYGRTTEGTEGFISEKAEIVALVEYKGLPKKTWFNTAVAKMNLNVPDGLYILIGSMFIMTPIAILALWVGLGFFHNPILSFIFILITIVSITVSHTMIKMDVGGYAKAYLNQGPSLKSLYPDVKFYKTKNALLEDSRMNKLSSVEPGSEAFWIMKG